MRALRVGIDVGGTFTDLVALDETSGALRRIKVPSTPRAPEEAVASALEALLADERADAVALVAHSTTIATNALLGQLNLALPVAALLTTAGFRDVLEIGRQNRSELYNLFVQRPRPLVERAARIGVRERMDPFGTVVEPLDPASLASALDAIERAGATTVAVAFLHSYANGAHERAAGEAVRARFPDIALALSCEVDPEYREYERTSTTVVHALLEPLVRGYLERLAVRARTLGIDAPIYVMQSNGGMASLDAVARRPATTIESGPASGVIAAAALARGLGIVDVLSFDMGGTTAKAGTIAGGEPHVANEFEAAGRTHSGRAVKGSGYPVRFPFVDLAEISAGGGTIANVDAGGALRVGPLSAGADPGPAAYGRGDHATVTDANLLLGRLNPRGLLGGALPLDAARARAALERLLPALPELDAISLAAGIVRLVDAEMAKIVRIVTVERGEDPRRFVLMAFGGGGPLHACSVAGELAIARIVVPRDPGLFSACGLLAAGVRATAVRALVAPADAVDADEVEARFGEMEREGGASLLAQGVPRDAIAFVREIDLRYLGQSFELTVAAPSPFESIARARTAFEERHRQAYGYASPGEPIEMVALRSTAFGAVRSAAPAPLDASPPARAPAVGALVDVRAVYAGEAGFVPTRVYARDALRAGDAFAGPALVEQYDTCTFVAPAWTARVDAGGNLHLEHRP